MSRLVSRSLVVIHVSLTLDDAEAQELSVSTTIEVQPSDPRWQARVIDAVTVQAEEGARRLVEQLDVLLPAAKARFLPLAATVPTIDVPR